MTSLSLAASPMRPPGSVVIAIAVGLMFVPTEFLSESARAMFSTLFQQPPRWAQLLTTCLYWLAVTLSEPVYIAAGFGLYLNRRTQLEAWDLELVFRRLAARARSLASAVAALLPVALLCAGLAFSTPASADSPPKKAPPAITPAGAAGAGRAATAAARGA